MSFGSRVRGAARCKAAVVFGAVALAATIGLVPLSSARSGSSGVLLSLELRDDSDLQSLTAFGATVRYSYRGRGVAQVPGSNLETFVARFPGAVVLDTLEPGVGYWLVVPGVGSAIDSIAAYAELTRLEQEGLWLVAVGEGLEECVSRFAFSMMPLPDRVEARALLRRRIPSVPALGAAARAAISPEKLELMREVAGRVSEDSVRAIVHCMSVDDSTGELRSRYTFRREAAWIPHMVREKLKAAMGGAGTDSLHGFPIRFFGIDTLLYNVVGVVPGRVPGTGRFVVCGHYDAIGNRTQYSEPGRYWDYRVDPAPGADDNATGLASVLECARALNGLQFDFDIEYVLFCAEEQGLFGSKAYTGYNDTLGSNIIGTLNFDMHGFRDLADSTFVRTNVSSAWLSDHVAAVSQALYDSLGLGVGITTIDGVIDASDHSSFWVRGYDAIHFFEHFSIPPLYPYYHTIYDTEDKVNFDLCRKVAALGAASLAYFAETGDSWDLEVQSGDIEFRVESSPWPVIRAVAGEVLTVVPSFHNVGGPASESLAVFVRVYDGDPAAGGRLVGERLVEGEMAAGASPEVQPFDWLLTERDVGEHAIYLVVDAGEGEGNVANNKASAELVVSSTSLALRHSFVFPNPLGPDGDGGKLRFFLTKEAGAVELDLYDVSGRRVGGCRDGSCGAVTLEPGDDNEIDLAAIIAEANLAPGVYSYRLRVEDGQDTKGCVGSFAVVR
ncbi:MAG: M28 family peptidase [Candidatus Eisenbacteria bacterium]|nr:M28 family peptidase [Candidatus Eisenbacteria bacterium]